MSRCALIYLAGIFAALSFSCVASFPAADACVRRAWTLLKVKVVPQCSASPGLQVERDCPRNYHEEGHQVLVDTKHPLRQRLCASGVEPGSRRVASSTPGAPGSSRVVHVAISPTAVPFPRAATIEQEATVSIVKHPVESMAAQRNKRRLSSGEANVTPDRSLRLGCVSVTAGATAGAHCLEVQVSQESPHSEVGKKDKRQHQEDEEERKEKKGKTHRPQRRGKQNKRRRKKKKTNENEQNL